MTPPYICIIGEKREAFGLPLFLCNYTFAVSLTCQDRPLG